MVEKSFPFWDTKSSPERWKGQPGDKSRSQENGYYQVLFINLSIPKKKKKSVSCIWACDLKIPRRIKPRVTSPKLLLV